MKIAIIGSGYVGLVTGTCLAEVGHDVTCVDTDQGKVKLLLDGISPIYEPGLEDLIKQNVAQKRLHFTTDLQAALQSTAVAFIAVGTPEGEDGSADLRYVKTVATAIGDLAPGPITVVVKSTVPVGTCDIVEVLVRDRFKRRGVDHQVIVASNPEFLKEGAAIDDFMKPDRIIVGLRGEGGSQIFTELYRPFILDDPAKLLFMDRRSSELTKYGSNAMLATRISFMNELSRLCEAVGADVDDVRRGMGADPRIGKKFLYAGPGYGGSCFPKDVAALQRSAKNYNVEFSVLNAVSHANLEQKKHVAGKVQEYFGADGIKGKRVAIWGLTFKPGTDDVRESPATTIINLLLSWGAEVIAHDPKGQQNFAKEYGDAPKLTYVATPHDALKDADALVLITEWNEYKRPSWSEVSKAMRTKAVFDLRNQYDGKMLAQMGFYYRCVGRPDAKVSL